MTFNDVIARYEPIAAKAEAVRRMIVARAEAACLKAGIDPAMMGTAGHNAMIAYRQGKPWRDVDYAALRRAFWLMQRSFEPKRVAGRAWTRLYAEWQSGGSR